MNQDEPPDSGPYCRHWRDPGDCDVPCARCNHVCGLHEQGGADDSACRGAPYAEPPAPDCPCEAWVEPDEDD